MKKEFNKIANLVEKKSKVLDVGCGDGELMKYITENITNDIRGLEISKSNVQKCVAKGLIDNAKVNQKQLRITVENGAEHIPIFMKTFTENKLNVKSVSANKPTLDDVFLKVTGFSMENDNQSEKKQSKKSNYEKRGRRIRR